MSPTLFNFDVFFVLFVVSMVFLTSSLLFLFSRGGEAKRTFSLYLKTKISDWLFSYDFEWVQLDKDAKLPTRAHDTDAGYDLYVSKNIEIPPNKMVNIPTGIAVKCNRPLWLMLIGRSSTIAKHKLAIDISVIDHNFTGELFVKCMNLNKEPKIVNAGMRIAQFIPLHHTIGNFTKVVDLKVEAGGRGAAGFGSSGN